MDAYYLQHEKLINEAWNEHYANLDYANLEDQLTGMDSYHVWGGGRFNSPPF